MVKEMLIGIAVRLILAAKLIYTRKWSFFALSFFVFVGSVSVLASLDLLPDTSAPVTGTAATSQSALAAAVAVSTVAPELPVKIQIPAIGMARTIVNPTSTNSEVLDNDLLLGAVRYPTSAKLGENGNVVLFGHSSYLPIVRNQAYKTFNDIQKLKSGDVVIVYSSGTAYTYRVKTFMKESATDAEIPLSVPGKILTLSTCDSFGAKTDRFVVTAEFVESHPIST